MHRAPLLATLDAYRETWGAGWLDHPGRDDRREREMAARIAAFARATPDGFRREHLAGHFTGSALVVDPRLERVLLTLHAGLGRWLQLGGHADGHPRLEEVALREAAEESGLPGLSLLDPGQLLRRSAARPPRPFDLDIHSIPARGEVPAHLHYDLRYLVICRAGTPPPVRNHESHALRWVDLDEARALTDEPSMLRQFHKLEALRRRREGAGAPELVEPEI